MFTHNFGLRLIGLFAAFVLSLGLLATPAHAQLISDAQIEEQQRVVMIEIVSTLEEHLKLLQMVFIQRLESQVALLQAQVDAQSS